MHGRYSGSRSGTGGFRSRYDDESRRIQQQEKADCVDCGIELLARNIQNKLSYHKSILKYHPDKSGDTVGVDKDDIKYYADSFRKINRCFKKFYKHDDSEELPCDPNTINEIKENQRNKERVNQRISEIQNNASEQKLFAKIHEKEDTERRNFSEERKRRNLSEERKRRNFSEERKEKERRNLSEERKRRNLSEERKRRNLSEEKRKEREKRKLEASIKQKQADEEYENNQERIKNKINSQAATKIQNIIRRSQAIKKRTKTSKERKAATKIQSIIRRNQSRKVLEEKKREEKIKIERPIIMTEQYDKLLKDVIKSAKKKNIRNLSYKSNARKMAEIAVEAANVGKNKFKNSPRKNVIKRKRNSESKSISTLLEKMMIRENSSKSPERKKQRK